MFTCTNCSHQIDDSKRLPPFCPRCGDPTGTGSSPFDDDDDALPPPPQMGSPLPPPPPMGAPLPPPPRSGRGAPSKTLFGMPGLSYDGKPDDSGLAFPVDDDDDAIPFPTDDDEEAGGDFAFPTDDDDDETGGDFAFPTDDDDDDETGGDFAFPTDDDDLAFPTDDDDEEPLLETPPLAAPTPPKPKPKPKPKAPPPPPASRVPKPPPVGRAKPPPLAGGGRPPAPPPRKTPAPPPPGRGKAPPPPSRGRGAPPRPPPGGQPVPPVPAYPSGRPPSAPQPTPPPPTTDPFASGVFSSDSGVLAADSGVLTGDSGVMAVAAQSGVAARSDTFDVDPFFTGDPKSMDELGSITHGDASQFEHDNPAGRSGVREFEFKDEGGETLELADLDHSVMAPMPRSELSQPSFDSPDFAGLDAPAPNDSAVAEIPVPRPTPNVDLPAPAGDAPDFELMPEGDLLPAPAGGVPDLDLPMPSGGAPDLDLPAPSGGGMSFDDLPMPADDLPMPADDLPMPADDLPAPSADLPTSLDDFPAPGAIDDFPAPDFDLDELPTPADSLPTPADSLPTPADSLPMSADILPTPADSLPTSAVPTPTVDDLDLDLDSMPVDESATAGEIQADAKPSEDPTRSAEPSVKAPGSRLTRRGSPAPKGSGRNIGRIVLYSILGLAVVGAGGFYAVTELGLFDGSEDPLPPQTEGGEEPLPPPTELAERPAGVLAKFDQDTPASYIQAYTLLEADPVGRAEAALLLHYRYGPDKDKLAEAGQLLAEHQAATEPFVRRVGGLALLGAGKVDEALAKLDSDDPRTALYRSWALLDKEQFALARKAAEVAVAARPTDQAARLAVLEARFAANPLDGLAAMRKALEAAPNHLALKESLMRAAHREGLLAEASTLGQSIQLPGTISSSHKAELLRERAMLAVAQGLTGEAMRLLEQALEQDAELLEARLDRIRLWLVNKDLGSARADLELLLRDNPQSPVVLKMAARADLEAGRDEDARQRLASLGEAGTKDPEALDLLGEADALLMKIDTARESYAKARAADPYYAPAIEHEVALLRKAQLPDAAVELLDAHAAVLAEANAKSTPRGREALAAVALARAEVLSSQGKTDAALTAAEEAIANNPAGNDARLLRALMLGELNQTEAHEKALLELHERTGGYPGLTEPFGKVLLAKNQLEELEKLIASSLESPEASREIILTGAALRLAQERPEEATVLARKVLDRDPTDSRAHLLLGRALLGTGDYASALSEIESAQTREGDSEVELWLGQALEYNSRANEAIPHYKRALELDEHNLEAAALLGRLYAYQGGAVKAMELLEPVVAKTDAYPYAHLALGLAHKDLGKRKLAITDFRKAQELDPTLFEAYYEEGRIHNDKNDHKQAVKALQAGIDNAKDSATERALIDTYRRLGESYKRLGRRADAKAAFQEYLKLAPPDAAGRRAVERELRDL